MNFSKGTSLENYYKKVQGSKGFFHLFGADESTGTSICPKAGKYPAFLRIKGQRLRLDIAV